MASRHVTLWFAGVVCLFAGADHSLSQSAPPPNNVEIIFVCPDRLPDDRDGRFLVVVDSDINGTGAAVTLDGVPCPTTEITSTLLLVEASANILTPGTMDVGIEINGVVNETNTLHVDAEPSPLALCRERAILQSLDLWTCFEDQLSDLEVALLNDVLGAPESAMALRKTFVDQGKALFSLFRDLLEEHLAAGVDCAEASGAPPAEITAVVDELKKTFKLTRQAADKFQNRSFAAALDFEQVADELIGSALFDALFAIFQDDYVKKICELAEKAKKRKNKPDNADQAISALKDAAKAEIEDALTPAQVLAAYRRNPRPLQVFIDLNCLIQISFDAQITILPGGAGANLNVANFSVTLIQPPPIGTFNLTMSRELRIFDILPGLFPGTIILVPTLTVEMPADVNLPGLTPGQAIAFPATTLAAALGPGAFGFGQVYGGTITLTAEVPGTGLAGGPNLCTDSETRGAVEP